MAAEEAKGKRVSETTQMETAIYHDFEPGKRKAKKGAGKPGQVVNQMPAIQAEAVLESNMLQSNMLPAESSCIAEEELRIMRLCANPRMLVCVYGENGVERRVLVRVKRNGNFAVGMTLKAKRSNREGEPWEYDGALPRFKGRW